MELALILLSSLLLTTRAAAAASNAVLDVDGDPVQSGQLYYLVSVRQPHGGLTLAGSQGSCPLNVAPAPLNKLFGDPLAFFPESGEATIRVRVTLYIMFAVPTQCPESTVWKGGQSGVTTGGTTSQSSEPHYSRFAISPAGDSSLQGYHILLCPCSVGPPWPSCRMGCLGAVAFPEDQNKGDRFVTTGANLPLTVNFVKVSNNKEPEQNIVIRSTALLRPDSVN